MRIHYLMHASFEPPGIIEKWAQDRGHNFDGTPTYTGKNLPDAAVVDFLIVMGGPQSPMRMNDYPYLSDEITFISTMICKTNRSLGFA